MMMRGSRVITLTLTLTVAAALAGPARPLLAAESPTTDIRVGKSVEEPDTVRAWAERAATDGLAAANVEASSGRRLVIEIGGVMSAFDVVVGVQEGGAWVGEPRKRRCECSAQDLVDSVRDDVVAVAPSLDETADASPPPVAAGAEPPPPSSPPEADRPPTGGRTPLAPMGKAGATLLGVGGVAAMTGLAFVIVGTRDRSSRASEREEADFRTPGFGVLGAGLAAVVVGGALLGVERSRAKRSRAKSRGQTTWMPAFDGRSALIVWGGRF